MWETRCQLHSVADPKFRERLVRELEGAAKCLDALSAVVGTNAKPAMAPVPDSSARKAKAAGG